MKEVVFEIDFESGRGRCLYHETVDLRRLGRLSLRRASHVVFRRRKQDFIVRLTEGGALGPFRSRRQAIREEVRFIQRRMSGKVEPVRVVVHEVPSSTPSGKRTGG